MQIHVLCLSSSGPTKNWIALEDSLQRSNEPNEIKSSIASSALRSPNYLFDDKNVFAIYVSYYVKVKLALSGMGGELSLKLPFTLAHFDRSNSDADEEQAEPNSTDNFSQDGEEVKGIENKEGTANSGGKKKFDNKPGLGDGECNSRRLRKNLTSLDQIETLSEDEMDEQDLLEFKRTFQNRQITELKSSSMEDTELLEEVFDDSMTLNTSDQNCTSSVSSVSSLTTTSTVARPCATTGAVTTSAATTAMNNTDEAEGNPVTNSGTTFVQVHAPLS